MKLFKKGIWGDKKPAKTSKSHTSRSIRTRLFNESMMEDVDRRRRPLSLMPGRFSSRSDCKLGGSEFRARFEKEEAESPDNDK